MNNLKIALAQIDVEAGNPIANANKCLAYILDAKNQGADIVVFSEMCISGYIIGDNWERASFLKDCERQGQKIIEASIGITVIFGNVAVDWNKNGDDGRPIRHNALFVAENGETNVHLPEGVETYPYAIKTLQPNYREFDDDRYFTSARREAFNSINQDIWGWVHPFTLSNGVCVGGIICEDGWKGDDDYKTDPMEILYQKDCELFINISCSPYTIGKNSKRNRVFGGRSKEYGVPVVYVNNVGVQNNGKTLYSFDGGSCVYDGYGDRIEPFEPFTEGLKIINVPVGYHSDPVAFGQLGITELKLDGIPEMYRAIRYTTEKFMKANKIENVVIGLSGGKDSAMSAGIFADILPAENLTLINMPSKFNSDITKNIAHNVADRIGCKYEVTPIEDFVGAASANIPEIIANVTLMENVQARARLQILATWAAKLGAVFPCNSNKSEMTVGYCTFYGDLSGFMAPIGDVWATQVYELMRYYQCYVKDIFPEDIFTVMPSAELSENQDVTQGKGDPFDYQYHDKLFASWIEHWNRKTPLDNLIAYLNGNLGESIGYDGVKFSTVKEFTEDLERWWNLYNGLAVAKRIQAPPVVAVSRRVCGGYDIRESQINPYYEEDYHKLKNEALKK